MGMSMHNSLTKLEDVSLKQINVRAAPLPTHSHDDFTQLAREINQCYATCSSNWVWFLDLLMCFRLQYVSHGLGVQH